MAAADRVTYIPDSLVRYRVGHAGTISNGKTGKLNNVVSAAAFYPLFAGFATDERYPLAFVCVVENGGYGATACIPILNRVLRECMAVLDAK